MANFCSSCGASLAAGASFCGNCGAKQAATPVQPQPAMPPPQQVQSQPVAPPPQTFSPAAPPPAKSSGLGKFLLIGCGVLAVVGMIGAAGIFYFGYKVKQKVETVAKEAGLDDRARTYGAALQRKSDICALLSKEELSELAGVTVTRAEAGDDSCEYFAEGAQAAQQGQAAAAEAIEKLEKNAPKNEEAARALLEQLGKGVAGAAAGQAGETSALKVTVSWGEARTQEPAFKIAMKAMTSGLPGKYMEDIADLGDRAYAGPMGAGLFVVKGDTWIEINAPLVAGREEAIAIARKVVSRL